VVGVGVTGADVVIAVGEAPAASVAAMVADPVDVVPEVDRDLGVRETVTAAASSRR
jgi:hypothetical protein